MTARVAPTEWRITTLEDVAEVCFGTRVTKKVDSGSTYPVYGGGGATFYMDEFNRESCVVISRFGMSERCVRRVEGKFFLNDSGLTVESKDSGLLWQPFLDLQMFALEAAIYELGRGTAQKNLNVPEFRCLPVFVPPLDEQKRIVAALDQAFAALGRARANAQANATDAANIFDSRMQALFRASGVERNIRKLGEVCSVTSSLVDPRQPEYRSAIHVGAGNIEPKSGRLFDLKTAEEEKLVSGKFPFDQTMVLYSKIRPYLEKVARPDFCGVCSADMYPLAPAEGQISRDFLYWLLLSKPFTDYAIQGSARAGMPKVNRDHLFQYEFELPSIDDQRRISVQLDALRTNVESLTSAYEKKASEIDELRQSLLQAAFSGALS